MTKLTVDSVMSDWTKFAATQKSASEQERLAGQSIPGSERNSPATPKPADHEVNDTAVTPASNRSNTPGAETATPTPSTPIMQPDDGAGVPVEEKPLVDATPALDKTASNKIEQMANAIMTDIIKHNEKRAADAAKPSPAKAPVGKVVKDVQPDQKATKVVVAPAVTSDTTSAGLKADEKAAGLDMEMTTNVLAKIAAYICSTEEGAAFVQAKLNEGLGPEKTASLNLYMDGQAKAYEASVKQAEAEYLEGVKAAEAIMQDPLFKLGQQLGAESLGMDPAMLEAAAAEAGGAPEAGGVPPEAMAPEGMAPEGMAPEGMAPEGLDEITEEDVIQGLQELVEEGKIDAETATALAARLLGGEGGDPAEEGGVPAEAAPAEAAPAEAAPAGEGAVPLAGEETPAEEKAEEKVEEKKEESGEGAEEPTKEEKEAALKTLNSVFKFAEAKRKAKK